MYRQIDLQECVSSKISHILRDRRVRCLFGGDVGDQYYLSFEIRTKRIVMVDIFQKVTENIRYLRGCEFDLQRARVGEKIAGIRKD